MIPLLPHIGRSDILWVTLDTLRFDVAERTLGAGDTPRLAELLGEQGWERRHTPGSFTYPAHHAFFAGFLPTKMDAPLAPRLFAARFAGSESTSDDTWVFDDADLPTALTATGYHTICIGGVGFFNQQTELGRVLPRLFAESHWSEALGVTGRDSTRAQVDLACERVDALQRGQRAFVFLNVSALHQPNYFFLPGAEQDSVDTMAAALRYADTHLGRLVDHLRRRAPLFVIVLSDHGTCYGEDDHVGHRIAHPVVWTVPYAVRHLEQREVT